MKIVSSSVKRMLTNDQWRQKCVFSPL